jgi:hypothetical protein
MPDNGVATEMKAGLESLIETYEADMRLKERRERFVAPGHGDVACQHPAAPPSPPSGLTEDE